MAQYFDRVFKRKMEDNKKNTENQFFNSGENTNDSTDTNNAGALGAMASAAGSTGNILTEYTVEERDTLSEIGRKHGIPWKEIYEANKDVIKDPDMIQPGWKLKIPNTKDK